MTDTLMSTAEAYAKDHPKPDLYPSDPSSWQDQCARLMYRWSKELDPDFAPRVTGPWASSVAADTYMYTDDIDDIKEGDYVWWSLPGNPAGHVGRVVKGSGRTARVFMASWAVSNMGKSIGTISAQGYTDKLNAKFLGASRGYAGAVPNEPEEEEEEVALKDEILGQSADGTFGEKTTSAATWLKTGVLNGIKTVASLARIETKLASVTAPEVDQAAVNAAVKTALTDPVVVGPLVKAILDAEAARLRQ